MRILIVNGLQMISAIHGLKACKVLLPEHEAQLLNYLKATEIEVGLLLNFSPSPEVKRKVFDNDRKNLGHYVRKYLDTDKI